MQHALLVPALARRLEGLISNVLLNANSNYNVRDLINKDNAEQEAGIWQRATGSRHIGCIHCPLNVDPVVNAKFKVKGDTDGICQCHFRMTVCVCVCIE